MEYLKFAPFNTELCIAIILIQMFTYVVNIFHLRYFMFISCYRISSLKTTITSLLFN